MFIYLTICKLTWVYRNSATLTDNILINTSDVDITRSNILSNICDFWSQLCFSHSFFQKPSSRNQLRINLSNSSINVFKSESGLTEAFSIQTIPSYQPDIVPVFSNFCNMLNTLARKYVPLRTSRFVYFRSVLAMNNKWQ